jgi:NTE family protein
MTCGAGELRGERPTVGLVLSGGAARGTAHIGVLRALEELSVPVDVIAGTSMGSIIGGLYASGMSPDEMEAWLESVDWHDLLDDRPARAVRDARVKNQELNFIDRLEMGVSARGLRAPSGMVSGQKLLHTLRTLTLPVAGLGDFDELPIPFRAVATDIENGDLIVMGSGDLAVAMRASMAVPGVFAPEEVDGRVLVDGMVVSNLPVRVVKEMRPRPDVIIAVDVGSDLKTREELGGALDYTSQMIALLTRQNEAVDKGMLGERDIIVRVAMPDASLSDFVGSLANVEAGHEAAMGEVERLRKLSVGAAGYEVYLARQRKERRREVILSGVRVNGGQDPARERAVMGKLDLPLGEPVDLVEVERQLLGVFDRGGYQLVTASTYYDEPGWILDVTTRDKPWGPNLLQTGVVMESDLSGATDIGLLVSVRMRQWNEWGGEWYTRLRLGGRDSVFSEFYQPLGARGDWFVAAVTEAWEERQVTMPAGEEQGAYEFKHQMLGGDVGLRPTPPLELRLGVRLEHGSSTPLGSDAGEREEDTLYLWRAAMLYDSLSSAYFPRSGQLMRIVAEYGWSDSDERDEILMGSLNYAIPLTYGPHTAVFSVGGSTSTGGELPLYRQYSLGGLNRLSGLRRGAIRGDSSFISSLNYYYKIADLSPQMGEGIYLGFSLEAGQVWARDDNRSPSDLLFGGSVYIGMDTLFGGLYLTVGHTESDTSLNLLLGRPF